jgi:hypothetical protein
MFITNLILLVLVFCFWLSNESYNIRLTLGPRLECSVQRAGSALYESPQHERLLSSTVCAQENDSSIRLCHACTLLFFNPRTFLCCLRMDSYYASLQPKRNNSLSIFRIVLKTLMIPFLLASARGIKLAQVQRKQETAAKEKSASMANSNHSRISPKK